MSERPTPEQILNDWAIAWRDFGASHGRDVPLPPARPPLAESGYVVVHPDDIPEQGYPRHLGLVDYASGWNDCRRAVVGDG